MPIEDFVGRWIAGNDRHKTATIEIKIVDGHLVVCAIDGCSGGLAEIQSLTCGHDEVRFTAYWSSGKTTAYRLLLSDGRLVVHFAFSDTDGTHNAGSTKSARAAITNMAATARHPQIRTAPCPPVRKRTHQERPIPEHDVQGSRERPRILTETVPPIISAKAGSRARRTMFLALRLGSARP